MQERWASWVQIATSGTSVHKLAWQMQRGARVLHSGKARECSKRLMHELTSSEDVY